MVVLAILSQVFLASSRKLATPGASDAEKEAARVRMKNLAPLICLAFAFGLVDHRVRPGDVADAYLVLEPVRRVLRVGRPALGGHHHDPARGVAPQFSGPRGADHEGSPPRPRQADLRVLDLLDVPVLLAVPGDLVRQPSGRDAVLQDAPRHRIPDGYVVLGRLVGPHQRAVGEGLAQRVDLHLGDPVLVPARSGSEEDVVVRRHDLVRVAGRLLDRAQRADLAVARAAEHLRIPRAGAVRDRGRLRWSLRAGGHALPQPLHGGPGEALSRSRAAPHGPRNCALAGRFARRARTDA